MVTLEDLLEELVGDIADEHDIVEEMILPDTDGSVLIDARMDLEEVNDKLGLEIEDDQFTTLGGHVFGCLGHEPSVGDEINTDGYTLRIEEADRHRITKLRLIRKEKETVDRSTESGANPTNGKPARRTKDDSVSQLEAS
jgi:Hemolysins and related proteins containing CBS domains